MPGFGAVHNANRREIQRLSGCLLFAKNKKRKTLFKDFISRAPTVIESLEKLNYFTMSLSRPGKVIEFVKSLKVVMNLVMCNEINCYSNLLWITFHIM